MTSMETHTFDVVSVSNADMCGDLNNIPCRVCASCALQATHIVMLYAEHGSAKSRPASD